MSIAMERVPTRGELRKDIPKGGCSHSNRWPIRSNRPATRKQRRKHPSAEILSHRRQLRAILTEAIHQTTFPSNFTKAPQQFAGPSICQKKRAY